MLSSWEDMPTAISEARSAFELTSDEEFRNRVMVASELQGTPSTVLGIEGAAKLSEEVGKLAKRIAESRPSPDRGRDPRWEALWGIAKPLIEDCSVVDLSRLLRAAVLCPSLPNRSCDEIAEVAQRKFLGNNQARLLGVSLAKAAGIALRDGNDGALRSVCAVSARLGFPFPLETPDGSTDPHSIQDFEIALQFSISTKGTPFLLRLWQQFVARSAPESSDIRLYDSFVKHAIHVADRNLIRQIVDYCINSSTETFDNPDIWLAVTNGAAGLGDKELLSTLWNRLRTDGKLSANAGASARFAIAAAQSGDAQLYRDVWDHVALGLHFEPHHLADIALACARLHLREMFKDVWAVLVGTLHDTALTMLCYEKLCTAAVQLRDVQCAREVWNHIEAHSPPSDINAKILEVLADAAAQLHAGGLLDSVISYAANRLSPSQLTSKLCCVFAEAAAQINDVTVLRKAWQTALNMPKSELQPQTFGRFSRAAGTVGDASLLSELWENYLNNVPPLPIQARTIGAFLHAGGQCRASAVIRRAWEKCVEHVPANEYSEILFGTALPAVATLHDRDLVRSVWAKCVDTLPSRSYNNQLYGSAMGAANAIGDHALLSRIWDQGRKNPPNEGWNARTYITAVYACGRFPELTALLAEVWAGCTADLPPNQWTGDLYFAWAIVISECRSAVLLQRLWQACSEPGALSAADCPRVYGVLAKGAAACCTPAILEEVWQSASSCIPAEDVLTWNSFASASAQLDSAEVFRSVWERWTTICTKSSHDTLALGSFVRAATLLRDTNFMADILNWSITILPPTHFAPGLYASFLRAARSLERFDLQLRVHETVVQRLTLITEAQRDVTPIKRLLGVFAMGEIEAFRQDPQLKEYLNREWDTLSEDPDLQRVGIAEIRTGKTLSRAARRALLDHEAMRTFLEEIQARSDTEAPAVLADLHTMIALQRIFSPGSPEDPYLLEKLAFVNRRVGNFDLARQISDHVSDIDPTPRTRAVAAMNDGWILLSRGEFLKAADTFAVAASLGGNYQGALLMASVCCRLGGNFGAARQHLQTLREGPDNEPWRTAVEWARLLWAEWSNTADRSDLKRTELDSACLELQRLLMPAYPARGAGATAIFAALASMWPYESAVKACSTVLGATPHANLFTAFQRAVEVRMIEAESHSAQEFLPPRVFEVLLKRFCDYKTPNKVRAALAGLLMVTLAQAYYGGTAITMSFHDFSRATLRAVLDHSPSFTGTLLTILFQTEPQAVMLELLRRYSDFALTALGPLLGDAETASENLRNPEIVKPIRAFLAELCPLWLLPSNYGGGDAVDLFDFVTDIVDDVFKDQSTVHEGSRISQPTRSAEPCQVRETECQRLAPLLRRLLDLESRSSPFHRFAQESGTWSIWTRVEGACLLFEYHFDEPDCENPRELALSTIQAVRELLNAVEFRANADLDCFAWEDKRRAIVRIRVSKPAEPQSALLPILTFARRTTLDNLEDKSSVSGTTVHLPSSAIRSALRQTNVNDWLKALIFFFDTKFAVTFHWVFLSKSSRSPRTAAHTLRNRLEIVAGARKAEDLASIRREALHFASEILRPIHAELSGSVGWTEVRPLIVELAKYVHKPIQFDAICPPGLFVRMQKRFLESVLINLLHNCLRALEAPGLEQRVVVDVRNEETKGRAQISFSNPYDRTYKFPDSTGIGHREIRSLVCDLSGGSVDIRESSSYEIVVTLRSAAPGMIAIGPQKR
jgi:signal transduction histidine kinase